MNDKNKKQEPAKPAGPDRTQAGVAVSLAACGLQTDRSSASISASIIADNLADGARGAAVTAGARLQPNVGQCVADLYDGKKPSAMDRVADGISSLTNLFSNARDNISAAVSDMAIKPGQGPTTVTIHNNTRPPEQRL